MFLNYDAISKETTLPELPSDYSTQIINKRSEIIDKIIREVFQKLPIGKKDRGLIKELSGIIFTRPFPIDNFTGVVISGYGEDEIFPVIVNMSIDGILDGLVIYNAVSSEKISLDNTAIIMPFAQQEMVYTFMEGINPDFQELVDGSLTKIFQTYPKILIDNIDGVEEKDAILGKLLQIGEKVKQDIYNEWANFKRKQFIDPIITAVAALPKDELAVMAETFVNITSFKRKMSMDVETVGGPIDVALISKGDGFVWIKRKHYFSPELNHHFFKNYYNDCEEEKIYDQIPEE